MKKIAVITVNYNTPGDTHAFLSSLERVSASDFSLEVFVVDNGSKQPFVLNKNEQKNNIHVTALKTNTGFAGGFNTGIRQGQQANADYILIVNNDTIVDPQMIHNLVRAFSVSNKIGVTVPKIYFAKGHEFHKNRYTKPELGRVFWYAGGHTDWANVTSIHRGVDEVDHGQYDKAEKTDFATGCCMMFKKEVLIKAGLFDERYFLYFEDADLNERIKAHGFDIYYVPGAHLAHVNASSSGGAGNTLQDYFITRNRMLFGMTYAPIRTKIALLRESIRLFFTGRTYQKRGIKDFYLRKFNKGTFFDASS